MSDFWDKAFIEKKNMWGNNPTLIAKETALLFSKNRFKTVLIPGIGYGRNAMPFISEGIRVTGVEISETAIELAKTYCGESLRIIKGSVLDMPFESSRYDGIFCHALIHLFDVNERTKFLMDCYNQLIDNGLMVFTAITKKASTYGVGELISKDRYKTKDGIDLFFYDEQTIQEEFCGIGLLEYEKVYEPVNADSNISTEFWKIVCRKR